MKIAMVAHGIHHGDGMGRVNYEIAKHAISLGHEVTAFSSRVEDDLLQAGAKAVIVRPRFRWPGLVNVRRFSNGVNRELAKRKGQFDVIIANGYTLTYPHDLNICAFVHGSWIHSPFHTSRVRRGPYAWYQWLFTRCNCKWELEALHAAKFIVAPSKLAADELMSIGIEREKMGVVYNGVDLVEFRPGHADRVSLGLPLGVPLALFAGDILTPRKNLDSVLRAMVSVPDLHLAVVGRLPRSPYPAMAAELGVADRVHFLGFRNDMGELFRAIDLFIFPSRYDTFALVVTEAMASGIPTITAPSAGAAELIEPGSGTVLPHADDVPALIEAIQRYLSDSELRRETAIAARRVAERYGWASMAQQYINLIVPPA